MAFFVGGLIVAFVLDAGGAAGRISLSACLAGTLIGLYVSDGGHEDATDDADRLTGWRYLVAFVITVVGAILSVILYPGWESYAVIALFGLIAYGTRWRRANGSAATE
jgi:hypothetical protein